MNNSERSLARINMQQMAIDNLQQEKENYKHEVEKITKVNQNYKHELEKMTKVNQNQEAELQHKSEEITHHINNAETLNEKIRELNSKIKVMTEIEFEHQRDQAEYRKEIEDLEASLSSHPHQEKIFYNDLQEAKKRMTNLLHKIPHWKVNKEGQMPMKKQTY